MNASRFPVKAQLSQHNVKPNYRVCSLWHRDILSLRRTLTNRFLQTSCYRNNLVYVQQQSSGAAFSGFLYIAWPVYINICGKLSPFIRFKFLHGARTLFQVPNYPFHSCQMHCRGVFQMGRQYARRSCWARRRPCREENQSDRYYYIHLVLVGIQRGRSLTVFYGCWTIRASYGSVVLHPRVIQRLHYQHCLRYQHWSFKFPF